MSHLIGVGTARSGTGVNAGDQRRIRLAFISQKHNQFTYFSMQLGEPDWSKKDVLDFGGNVGNILRDPNSNIDSKRYWCIDVSKEAIECGRRAFPESHWIAYDRRCFFFNPGGIPGLPLPRMAQTFDYIVAYSVFTNTPRSDMLELVDELQLRLNPGGALAFTFIDPHHRSWPGEYEGDNLLWRLRREQELHPEVSIDIERIRRDAEDARGFMLVNGTDLYLVSDELPAYPAHEQRTCHVFHTEDYMKALFPNARVLPPVNNEMQHCCIIRK
jgi:SAM-dependent methyltransferase